MSTPFGMDEKAVVRGTELRLDVLIAGLMKSVPPSVTTIVVNGVAIPIADVIQKTLEIEKPWKDSRAAQATIRAVAQTRERDEAEALAYLNDVKVGLFAALGRESQLLTEFGFKPQKRRKPLSVEEKIVAAAKAKLTREMRHTMSPRQKAEIKATETPVITIGPEGTEVATGEEKPAPPVS